MDVLELLKQGQTREGMVILESFFDESHEPGTEAFISEEKSQLFSHNYNVNVYPSENEVRMNANYNYLTPGLKRVVNNLRFVGYVVTRLNSCPNPLASQKPA